MKGRIQKHTEGVSIEEIVDSIAASNLWIVFTITENKQGAAVAVRESHKGALVDTIALLLEQKEIYELVQKKIASVKLATKKQGNSPPTNTDIN